MKTDEVYLEGQYLICGRNANRKRMYVPPLLDPDITNHALAAAYGVTRNTMAKMRVRVREMVYKKLGNA
jgi:hypothetical protein